MVGGNSASRSWWNWMRPVSAASRIFFARSFPMPEIASSCVSSSSDTRTPACATVSEAFRYARILNGFSPLISSRSPTSANRRASAALSTAGLYGAPARAVFRLQCRSTMPPSPMSPRALRHQVGQLLVAGFPGPSLPAELRAIAREFSLGGVIFFKRNVEDPEQVAEVAREIRQLGTEDVPWVAVDQEGGRVARFK